MRFLKAVPTPARRATVPEPAPPRQIDGIPVSAADTSRVTVARSRKGRLRRFRKLIRLAPKPTYWRPLKHRVAAAIEHESVPFAHSFHTIIDVGAHHGQFALFANHRYPGARLHCVEPLPEALRKLEAIRPQHAVLHPLAAAAVSGSREFHVSRSTDSSSLLPISDLYTTAFPGTEQERMAIVECRRLDELLAPEDLARPCLLKIDVQGSELEVLEGAEGILDCIDEVFVECSFVEFYRGQGLVDDVVSSLRAREFRLVGVFSVVRDSAGRCLQADLLFSRGAE
jgi:FkbM family methyltransferase